jgi:hypothetical protein
LKSSANPLPIGHEGFESSDLLSFEDHLPGVGFMVADDTVEQGCFAGPIRTDQTDDFTLIDLEGNMVIGHHTAEVFHEIDHFEKCHAMYPFFETAQ